MKLDGAFRREVFLKTSLTRFLKTEMSVKSFKSSNRKFININFMYVKSEVACSNTGNHCSFSRFWQHPFWLSLLLHGSSPRLYTPIPHAYSLITASWVFSQPHEIRENMLRENITQNSIMHSTLGSFVESLINNFWRCNTFRAQIFLGYYSFFLARISSYHVVVW